MSRANFLRQRNVLGLPDHLFLTHTCMLWGSMCEPCTLTCMIRPLVHINAV